MARTGFGSDIFTNPGSSSGNNYGADVLTPRRRSGVPPFPGIDPGSLLSMGSDYGAGRIPPAPFGGMPAPPGNNFDPSSWLQSFLPGGGENDPFNLNRSKSGSKSASYGDSANSLYNLAAWLFGQGGGLTSGSYGLFNNLLSGNYQGDAPGGLGGRFPADFANQLQQGTEGMSDYWGKRSGEMQQQMVDNTRSNVFDPAMAAARDALHTQTMADVARGRERIDEETTGGVRAKGQMELEDKGVASEAQGIQKLYSDLTTGLLGPASQTGNAMMANIQNMIAGMGPQALLQQMGADNQFKGMGLQAGMNMPSQLMNFLTSLAQIRLNAKQINSSGGGGGGILGSLMGMFS